MTQATAVLLPKPIPAKCIELPMSNKYLPHALKLNKPYFILAMEGQFVMIKYPNAPKGHTDMPIFHKSAFLIPERNDNK